MTIQAIETRYAGYRFRSRLEARWAVFFDHLGVKWEYEPQGYLVGPDAISYLPDFWLPEWRMWVEVKGQLDQAAIEKLLLAAGPSGLPRHKSKDSNIQESRVLLLGAIPEPGRWLHARMDLIDPPGSGFEMVVLVYTTFAGLKGGEWRSAQVGPPIGVLYEDPPDFDQAYLDRLLSSWPCFGKPGPTSELLVAYRAARSARFEHGENGGGP